LAGHQQDLRETCPTFALASDAAEMIKAPATRAYLGNPSLCWHLKVTSRQERGNFVSFEVSSEILLQGH
jgi:hypothetical protein